MRSVAFKVALLCVGFALFSIALLPIAWFLAPTNDYSLSALKFMLATGLIHGLYFAALGWAYEIGEISVVFPVSRGLGIICTAGASILLARHGVSTFGAFGIGAIAAGTLSIGLKELPERKRRKAFAAAALVALTVSSYTMLDSYAAKFVSPLTYITGMSLFSPIFAAPLLVQLRNEIRVVLKRHKRESFFVAFAGCFAYLIIFWAYSQSAAPYVAALRELAVVIASILGIVLLREELSKRKIIGICLILSGAILLRFA
jgi:uncharacterized membrane protein